MNEKKDALKTLFRIIFLVLLQIALYRHEKVETMLMAIATTAIVFWVLPSLVSNLICRILKIEDEYGGTLKYDDSDPTDCKFRLIFDFEPEDLIKKDSFEIKVEKANLRGRDENRD